MKRLCVASIALACVACSTKEEPPAAQQPPAPSAPPVTGEAPAPGPTTETPAPSPTPAASQPETAERPLYYERVIAPADLEKRTLRELSLMRNTIFARAGNPFRKKWLRDHFEAQPWYHALDRTDESKLTDIDRQNAVLIAGAEAAFTRAELEKRLAEVQARASGGAAAPDDEIELRLLSARLGVWKGSAGVPRGERSPLEDPSMLDALLDLKALGNLSRRDLRLLRNTIYARRGRPFKSVLLTEYFDGMAWYRADDAYSDTRLTAVDKKNIRLVRSVEDSLGGPLSEHEHEKEEGWFEGA
ncbi:MAG TPA: YARHG domain-containing protein [Kofleriaceae bacterium]|nr:YARHG domain-containing protein [Kofleriaceae bacterium]